MSKIAVGMSGGVDSSVAAALLKRAGHEVIGISMRIWSGEAVSQASVRHSCYGPSEEADIRDADIVASGLGIPFHVVDLRQEYRAEVLEYSRKEYLSGRTPNPCVRCNRRVKFDALLKRAHDSGLEFEYFATGHYARVERAEESGRYLLKKGKESKKDQSYFLFYLSQSQLSKCLFPVGKYSKAEVREIARDLGLATHGKTESQDFIEGGYASLVQGGSPGPILDTQGNVLGEHRGIAFYTVGQRRGIGISAREPLYVSAVDCQKNAIVVGSRKDVLGGELIASQLNWIALERLERPITAQAKIRQSHEAADAVIQPLSDNDNRVHVEFKQHQLAITPGQAIVFYDGDTVIGGGIIERAGGPNGTRPENTD